MYFVYECIIIKDFCPLVKVTKSQQHFCFKFKISNKIMVFVNGIYQKIVVWRETFLCITTPNFFQF